MLSLNERSLIENFLEDLPSEDLYALAVTVSQSNLQPSSRQDAINIICQHSECIESVLQKKRIQKVYLYKFLHKNDVSITFSSDKPALIRKVLEFWSKLQIQSKKFECKNIPQENQTTSQNENTSNYFGQLSYKFSEWFYSLMNDDDPSKLGPEHFFNDSQVKLALHENNSTNLMEANTSIDAARVFYELHCKYRLKFLPNLTPNAIKYQSDIHGQVMLFVSGTLHARDTSQVVGLFEQMFLLIRDITDNQNWKIRNSQIILKSSNVSIGPSKSSNNSPLICEIP